MVVKVIQQKKLVEIDRSESILKHLKYQTLQQ